jgi:hypothetical protein
VARLGSRAHECGGGSVALWGSPRELGLHASDLGRDALCGVRVHLDRLARAGRVRALGDGLGRRMSASARSSASRARRFGVEASPDEEERSVHERGGGAVASTVCGEYKQGAGRRTWTRPKAEVNCTGFARVMNAVISL